MIKSPKWQNLTSFLTALSLILANGLLGRRIDPAFAESKFKDIQNHWAKACIEDLAEKKILSGYYEDGTFRPDRRVSRAEFAAIIIKAFPNFKPIRDPIAFADLPTDYWAYKSIIEAYKIGFISGYSGKIFNPTLNIPRWQVLVSLSAGLKYAPTLPTNDILQTTFTDAADIPALAKNAIAAATEKQLVVNYPKVKELKPNQEASRAEVAAFLCQAISKSGQNALVPVQYIAQIPGNITPTKIEVSGMGKVRAEFAYKPQGENSKDWRIKIVRDGKSILDDAVFIPVTFDQNDGTKPREEISEGSFVSLKVQDLEGDREPEILLDLMLGKKSAKRDFYSLIYRYESITKRYSLIKNLWGNVSYKIEDLDGDNLPEFKTEDDRFAEVFSPTTAPKLPLRIFQYRQGKMLDVTKNYPVQVYTNASELWLESRKRQSNNQDVKGVFAAYMASKYLLGQEAEGWQLLDKVYQGSDRTQFFAQLRQFLANNGYVTGQNTADKPQDKPDTKPQDKPDTKPQDKPDTKPQDKPDTKPQDKPDTKPQDKPDTKPQDKPDTKPQDKPDNGNKNEITTKLLRTLPASKNPVFSVAISPDGQILAASSKQEIKLWNLKNGELLRTLSGHEGNVWSVAISPDGKNLISGSGDGSLILWDIASGKIRRTFSHVGGWVNAVGFTSDGQTMISCSHNKGINLWDITTGELLYSLDGFNPMAIAASGRIFGSSGGPSDIKIWDVVTGKLVNNLAIPPVAGGGIKTMAISRDGLTLAYGMSGNSRIEVWDLRRRQRLYTLEGHLAGVNAIAISPDGETLASSSGDRTLKLWNLKTGKLIQSMGGLGAIVFSNNGQILVNVSQDNSLQIWQLSATKTAR
jgi:S-layer homology domain/WD domain, G-beta repeat